MSSSVSELYRSTLRPSLASAPPLSGGMMGQAREAKSAEINATVGSSLRDGKLYVLPGMEQYFQPDALSYGDIFARQPADLWCRFITTFCEHPFDSCGPQNALATHGIAEGLDLVGAAHLAPGDPIILPDQTWPNINNLFIRWHEAKPYLFRFFNQDNAYNVDGIAQQLAQIQNDGHDKAVIYLNSPTNPNGYVLRPSDIAALRQTLTEFARHLNLVIISDEAYMSLSYVDDGHRGPLAEHLVDLPDNVFVYSLTGVSKLLQLFGTRCGFVSLWHADSDLWTTVQERLTWLARTKRSFANHQILNRIGAAIAQPDRWKDALKERFAIFKQRFDATWDAANRYASQGGWTVYPGGGGYFLLMRVQGQSTDAFRLKALEKAGVGLITQGDENVRFAFSCVEASHIPDIFSRLSRCHP